MDLTGSLIVRVTTSRAELPVAGASVVVTSPTKEGKHILKAMMSTDESGLTSPIQLLAPTTESHGTTPGGPTPYNIYSLWVEHPGYQIAFVDSLQIFPGVESAQHISLIPLAGASPESGGNNGHITADPQDL